nr:MAG TPA: hypothetical protein [Caudoviricetes sp.]
MSDKLIVESVENTKEQLTFMPLKGSIRLKLSDNVSPELIKNNISVYRVKKSDGVKSLDISYSDAYTQDLAGFADIDITSSGQALIVSPKDSFIPSSDYILYISKDVHSVKNKVTVGQNEVDSVTISPPIENKIEIIPVSQILGDVFVCNVKIDNKPYLDNELFSLEDGIVINGSRIKITDQSIISGASIIISSEVSKTLEADYSLHFSTGSTTGIEDKVPDGSSKRITTDDIMSFYNSPYRDIIGNSGSSVGTLGHGNQNTPGVNQNNNTSAVISFRLPNKILIKFEKEIDKDNTDISSIDIDIYEAFDNYNLPKMGLYNEDLKYILEFSLIRGNKTLQIELLPDLRSEVPVGEKYIKRWK